MWMHWEIPTQDKWVLALVNFVTSHFMYVLRSVDELHTETHFFNLYVATHVYMDRGE